MEWESMLKFHSEFLELQDEDSNEHMVKFYYHALVQGWAWEPGIKAIERFREVLLQLKMERVNTYKKEINGKRNYEVKGKQNEFEESKIF